MRYLSAKLPGRAVVTAIDPGKTENVVAIGEGGPHDDGPRTFGDVRDDPWCPKSLSPEEQNRLQKLAAAISARGQTAATFFLRVAEDGDLNYVRKTWLQEHAQNSDFIDEVGGGKVYFPEHAKCRDVVLDRAAVLIACRPNVPTGICGFAVTELDATTGDALIHFVFVKERWRRLGVASLLLEPFRGKRAICTHRTKVCSSLPLPEGWSFNPYPFLRSQS